MAVANHLKCSPDVLPVFFDAWRYEATDHIIVPLLHAIFSEVQRLKSATLASKVRTALLSVVDSLTLSIGPISVKGERLIPPTPVDDIADLDKLFTKPYSDMRSAAETLAPQRIAVLIDDLDRCSPGKILSLLESINLVMDIPGFVFVLALDYDVLAKAVTTRYPYTSGHVFIEKMVQVPFRVPRLSLPRRGFLDELIPGWRERMKSLPVGFEQAVYDVAILGLNANPRQIKRLINSVLVLLGIARDIGIRANARILAGLVGLQLRWPDEYGDLVEAVLADDPQPLTSVTSEEKSALRRYTKSFFPPGTSAEKLRPYLQLAESVAVPASTNSDNAGSPAGSKVREHKRELQDVLEKRGYKTEADVANVYVHERNPGYRVRLGATVVRFEVNGDKGWRSCLSFRISDEYSDALALISNRRKMAQAIRNAEIGR
jgi:hypothetical protein